MAMHADGSTVENANIVLMVICTLTVACRMYTRFWMRRDPGIDDRYITASCIIAWVMAIFEGVQEINQARHGLGSTAHQLSTTHNEHILFAFWNAIWSYHVSMGFVRLSVFLQVMRVFPDSRVGKKGYFMWLIIAYNMVNTLWATLSSILICLPVWKFWHPMYTGGHCLSKEVLYLFNSSSAMVLDFICATLPLPFIRRLQLPLVQKVLVGTLFVLAGMPFVLACVRLQSLIAVTTGSGGGFTDSILGIVSSSEIYVAIICANLPSLRTLYIGIRPACVRQSQAFCEWLPCSCCEHTSGRAGFSFAVLKRNFKSWIRARRAAGSTTIVLSEHQPHPSLARFEFEGQEQVSSDWSFPKAAQTKTAQVEITAGRWAGRNASRLPRLGLLPSLVGNSTQLGAVVEATTRQPSELVTTTIENVMTTAQAREASRQDRV